MGRGNNKFVGCPVILMASDPWDFGTENGCGPFHGTVIRSNIVDSDEHDFIVVKLDASLIYKGIKSEYLMVDNRHVNEYLSRIQDSDHVSCNADFLSQDEVDDPGLSPLLKSWRPGFIGSIALASKCK